MAKKIAFIIFTVLLVFFTLEISFRVMYSVKYRNFGYMMYGLKDVFKFDVDYFNEYIKLGKPLKEGEEASHGFRTAPFSIEKPEGEYRIVALGESSTYGLYVEYQKSWPYLLEHKLNQELNDRRYKVINAGIPGQTTYGVRSLLEAEVLSWNPDLVIVNTLYNHVDIDVVAFYQKTKADYLFRLVKGLFYGRSLLVTHLVDFIGSRAGLLQDKKEKYRSLSPI